MASVAKSSDRKPCRTHDYQLQACHATQVAQGSTSEPASHTPVIRACTPVPEGALTQNQPTDDYARQNRSQRHNSRIELQGAVAGHRATVFHVKPKTACAGRRPVPEHRAMPKYGTMPAYD